MIDSTRQFRKINSTCSQRSSCVWWSEGKALSPVFGLSSHLSWPLKFLYWCWVINSHQSAILLLILSSWALSRAKPRLRHGPGILALGDWDLKMQGCLWVSPPFHFYDPSERNLIMVSIYWALLMHQESSVFSDLCVWTHPTQIKSNFVESRCHSPYRASCFEKMNKYIVPSRLHMTMPYTRSSLSVSYPLSFEPTPHCRLMLFCWCHPNASFDLLTPPRWHSSVGLSPTYVIDGLSSTPTCHLSGFFL